ncbi:MAG: type II secretion system F family protein [Candidatus Sungbacteria bacterium]|nr:type II secretion system F family protein [Candidatus Sungbacteria bacterium]
MSVFVYKARSKEGEARDGTVEAPSLEAAIDVLQRNNLIIIEVLPKIEPGRLFVGGKLKFFNRVKQKDIVLLSRQLSTLFEAKVPVVQALKTLVNESSAVLLKEAMASVLDDVNGGASLSAALGKHSNIFSQFYVSMVRSGEESGKLQEVFTYLADYLERSYVLTSKAKNAMIYPAFVFSSFIGVVVVMLVIVIPKLTAIFEETGQAVPFYTQLVIAASYFLRSWGWVILLLLIGGAVMIWRYAKTEDGSEILAELQLKIPVFGELYQKIYLTRFADNLATLIVAGLPILRALQITSEIVGNKIYEKSISRAVESVKGGNTIASALEGSPGIPPMVIQMIRIGEEAGRLDSILKNIAKFYQRDVDSLLDNIVSLIEPTMIIFLGVAVGGLVASILVPLYNLSSAF